MRLNEILNAKGSLVHTITPSATLADVVAKLVENNCGSLVVCEGDAMVGIITERDILRATAKRLGTLEQLTVKDFMTSSVITGLAEDTVEEIMGVMTTKRIRHLPILDSGRLAGMISIGDLVKAQHDQLCMENYYLKSYIQS